MNTVLCLALLVMPRVAEDSSKVMLPPGITMEKAFAGWIALYDGATTYGWNAEGNTNIDQGILTVGGEKEASLVTKSAFSSCEFSMTYRVEGKDGGFHVTTADGKIDKTEKKSSSSGEFGEFTFSIPNSTKSGAITIATHPGTTLNIKSIVLKPLGTKSIFNSKNLEGWKEIPGKKSKFSVIDGAINVKDGNSDLQTVEQWDDFVLQMDIISHGDHLNSGIFYRCLPDVFWSGYEAQVRNEWQTTVKLKDGTSFTGSLTAKGDVLELKTGRETKKFAKTDVETITDHRDKPIDIGSGGIYNRCPARKVVSTDREWYTMTVLANGNHHAVWVNGFQTADFTDTKPINRSARAGRKDDAGPISIQGHDPTTDLSFKNIRIAPLPK